MSWRYPGYPLVSRDWTTSHVANPANVANLVPPGLYPQELHRRYEGAPESAKTKALQTVIEMKVRTSVCTR